MPTTVNSDIGGGANDYADPFLWEAATDNDLVTADQVQVGRLYGEHTGNLTIDGATTDATRYRILQRASGQGLVGTSDPYAYDGTKGAAITSASTYTAAACFVNENFSRVVGIQVRTTANTNQPFRSDNGNSFTQCLGQGSSTSRSVAQSAAVAGVAFTACTFINRGASSSGACVTLYLGGTLQNCTIVTPSDLADPADAITINFPDGTAIIRNNVVCGFTSVGTIGTPATCTNNYTDAGSPPSGFSAITYTTSTGAGNAGFENITDGTHDFRIKAASALVGAGTATGAPSTDMAGRSYAGTPSVGAMEGAAGSAPTITAQPVGSAAAVGATTQFSITSGDATSYQWQVSADGGETWANVSGGSGGTTATYTTATTTTAYNGWQYRCVATNANGSTNSLGAWFHVSGIGLTGRGRGTSRERYSALFDPQMLVRLDPRVCPESGYSCFDDFAAAFKDLYFYSDPPPPPPELERWEWTTRNRPGSGPLSTGKFFIAQRPIITAAAAVPQVNATPGAWTWAGVAVGRFRLVAATPGAWTWTGPTVGRFRLVAATPGTWTWTGPAAGLSRIVSATPGAWTWAGVGAQLVTTATVNASPGAWTWAGVGVGRFRVTNATPGAWTWAGVASSLSRAVSASPGAWTWAGVSVGRSRLTNATPGVWTWAGTTTGISVAGSVNATPGAFTWAGTSSGLSRLVHATPGAWTWTGPSVGRSRLVAATPGAFSWAGTASTLRRLVAATPGAWSWSGTQSGIVSLVVVNAAAGQWTWVGNRSGISTGAASADATGGWPIAAMVAEMRRRAQRERERLKALEEEEEERQRAIARAKSPPAKEKAKASLEKTKLALANQERLLAILTQEIAQALAEEARAAEEAEEREVIELFLEML